MSIVRALPLVVFVALSSNTDVDQQSCLATVYQGYADAQRTWQRSLRDAVASARVEEAVPTVVEGS